MLKTQVSCLFPTEIFGRIFLEDWLIGIRNKDNIIDILLI